MTIRVKMIVCTGIVLFAATLSISEVSGAEVRITGVEPTPFFPKAEGGEKLQQSVKLGIDNGGMSDSIVARVTVAGKKGKVQPLGNVPKGKTVLEILVPDIDKPSAITVELLAGEGGQVLASRTVDWTPQKKWTIYNVCYSHQDLGFGDYPHRLRTTIRHANIRLPLQFCRETDSFSWEGKHRYVIETAEPVTSFIGFFGKEAARELARRMKEGRIQLNGLHNTASLEQYGHELMARQFYLAGRHVPDMLNVEQPRVFQQTDVIGVPLSLPTYASEAGFKHFFHGYNKVAHSAGQYPLVSEPNFYLQGPDGSRLLSFVSRYSAPYSRLRPAYNWKNRAKSPPERNMRERVGQIVDYYRKFPWPYNSVPSPEGSDYALAEKKNSVVINQWSSEYAYPRLISATWQMYFEAIESELKKEDKLKAVCVDMNNQWTDQDSSDARLLGRARIAGEAIPATEKLASIAQMLTGGNTTWLDLYQAYHRIMQYHEHTNAGRSSGASEGDVTYYETELWENREMVSEALAFQQKVRLDAQQRLSQAITRRQEKNVVVFNPLARERTEVVRCGAGVVPAGMQVVDSETGKSAACQHLSDGTVVFLAENIPAAGYRVYGLQKAALAYKSDLRKGKVIENDYYRMELDERNGAVKSLRDKALDIELLDQDAPTGLNEYLFQQTMSNKRGKGKKKQQTAAGALQYKNMPTHRMEQAEVSIVSGPVADVVTVKGKALGARAIQQTILLYRKHKRIDFGLFIDKAPAGNIKEAVYVAFPFNVPDFTLRHELPGVVIEPFKQQIEGSCTAHYTIRSFTDVSNDKYGVTVSPIDSALVCYGWPRPSPMLGGNASLFDRSQEYPEKSWLYLYLMNNMFFVNIVEDQQGPVNFQWAVRSHAGGWKEGGADRFGRSVLQPLIAWRADGSNDGKWPTAGSFVTIDKPNVTCSTIKPAEANGSGMIMRFNEMTGRETTVTVALPVLGRIDSATETSIVETDRGALKINSGNSFTFKIKPFGVKTVRVIRQPDSALAVPVFTKATAVADMAVALAWKNDMQEGEVSHFNIYRDTNKACEPNMLNFVGQATSAGYTDKPALNHGGWVRNRLQPDTTYYYRVAVVDRYNNIGKPSEPIAVTTLKQEEKNLAPVKVEAVLPVPVSPIKRYNFINLLFRTSCESDIACYEVHRSEKPDFTPRADTCIGKVDNNAVIGGGSGYGKTGIPYPVKDFDHAMFADKTVKAGTTYYYRVCAVDTAGQKGEFSDASMVRTKD